jgi:hypothetical protein
MRVLATRLNAAVIGIQAPPLLQSKGKVSPAACAQYKPRPSNSTANAALTIAADASQIAKQYDNAGYQR